MTRITLLLLVVLALCLPASATKYYIDRDNCNNQGGAGYPVGVHSNMGAAGLANVCGADRQYYCDLSDDNWAAVAAQLAGYEAQGYTVANGKVVVMFDFVPNCCGWSDTPPPYPNWCPVHLCALWSETDWTEGNGVSVTDYNWTTAAAATEMYAQDVVAGTPVQWQFPGDAGRQNTMLDCVWTQANRYLADPFDPENGACKTIQNSQDAEIGFWHEGAYYDVHLDEALIRDLLDNPNNRGLVMVHLPATDQKGDPNVLTDKRVRTREYGATDFDPFIRVVLAGDANEDDCVDGLDYNNWSLNYDPDKDPRLDFDYINKTPGWGHGDFNCDQVVDGLDYNVWSLNYEAGCPEASAAGAAVPEPAALCLFSAAACLLVRRRRQA